MKKWILALCLFIFFVSSVDARPSTQRSDSQEKEKVLRWVKQTVVRAFASHDIQKYVSLWLPTSRWVVGRGATPDRFDTVLSYKKFIASKMLRSHGSAPKNLRYVFHHTKLALAGKRAQLSWHLTRLLPGSLEKVGQQFKLKKTAQGWKIQEFRWWPIRSVNGAETKLYAQANWRELDEAVMRAKANQKGQGTSLLAAFRFREALLFLSAATKKPSATAFQWFSLGVVGAFLGEIPLALSAFRKAKEQSPAIKLPSYLPKNF